MIAAALFCAEHNCAVSAPLHRASAGAAVVIVRWNESNSLELLDARAADDVHARFAAARERGHEGLMFKSADSPYAPGRRGKWWLKLKRELSTLDCVVVAVEWGHGRRAQVLSDYTFALWGTAGLVPIGKAYGGLTDVEIAFDAIMPSERRASGYALRFPRIARRRLDKRAADADTLARVDAVYAEMLAREGVVR